jgi:hypothetical protein
MKYHCYDSIKNQCSIPQDNERTPGIFASKPHNFHYYIADLNLYFEYCIHYIKIVLSDHIS